MANNYIYPSLDQILPIENIPNNLGWINDGLVNIVQNFYYRDLIYKISPNKEVGYFYLKLVLLDRLGFEIPGTHGLFLLLNPAPDQNGISEIPIALNYRWEIVKYLNKFDYSVFKGDPRAFFDLFLQIIDIEKEELLSELIKIFINDPNPIQKFIDDFNIEHAQTISPLFDADKRVYLLNVITEIETNGFDIFSIIFQDYIGTILNVDDVLDNLKRLFYKWLGNFGFKDILTILTPQANASIDSVLIALEFPPTIVKPVDSQLSKSILSFQVGKLVHNTQNGLEFYGGSGFSFTKSTILNTGLTLEITNMKLDLSRTTNIPEATADGRPLDFIGAYITRATIGLPTKWFKEEEGNTLGLFTRNLLIGTGGISGLISLEALEGTGGDGEMVFCLGKKRDDAAPRKGFSIGFREFYLKFQQNAIVESRIKGSLSIPKFKQCGSTGELKLNIEAFFEQDGDFRIVVDPGEVGPNDEIIICFKDVFKIKIKNLEIGKDDDRVYVQLSGALSFENNEKLSNLLKGDFEVEKFRIYSDGSFELEGGSITLPNSVELPLGPVSITISAIHFGAHTQMYNGVMREYKYFGFDGGISVDPGGVDARGDGVKFYFTVDDGEPHSFLQIEGIGINLIIPANATRTTATLLLEGYLALRENEYQGTINFDLPKANIAGGASMTYRPKDPSFLVDVSLDLAAPLPLASTGLGFYGFRALFGLGYQASKERVGAANWYEYYKAPPLGIDTQKFVTPENGDDQTRPLSIGAGTVLATLTDDGKAFSSRLFLLLSIPNLILLEGKANVMGKRLGLLETNDPPFYAMISYSPGDSVEVGFGANYNMPREGGKAGWISKLKAEVQAGYFFNDSSAWFVHIGTKDKPVAARLLDTFNGYSYLMLSARGIEAGAGIDFEFKREYLEKTVKVWVKVYMDVWGQISFPKQQSGGNEKTQFGGGIAVGGHVEGKVLGIGIYIGIDTVLTAQAPKPFIVSGAARLCAGVKVFGKKVEKCFTVEFIWERDKVPNLSPIHALPASITPQQPLPGAIAVHMLSGKTYAITDIPHPLNA